MQDVRTAYQAYLTAPGRFTLDALDRALEVYDPASASRQPLKAEADLLQSAVKRPVFTGLAMRGLSGSIFRPDRPAVSQEHDLAARLCEAVGQQVSALVPPRLL